MEKVCPCKRKCERHAICEECRAHHRKANEPTFCERKELRTLRRAKSRLTKTEESDK